MPGMLYMLCAVTSFLCAFLLFRGYRQTHMRLLLWSSICFVGMTADNLLVFADKIVWPGVDFTMVRSMPGMLGLLALLFGLVWDAK